MDDAILPCTIQRKALEMIVQDEPVPSVLAMILATIDRNVEGLFCSVLALDEDGVHVRPLVAPSLPEAYSQALDGVAIGRGSGSCGTAMYIKQPVIVSDIAEDPLWLPFRELALSYGLRACWSVPICLTGKPVMGSLAMYYDRVMHPDERAWRTIMDAMNLVALCLERERQNRQLLRAQQHLEQTVEERTRELSVALSHLRNTQQELLNREKMAALGMLVAGVAHELNTPIGNAILSSSFLADCQLRLSTALRDGVLGRTQLSTSLHDAEAALILVQRNLEKAADLIGHFKQMAVDQSSERRRSFDLREVINDNVVTFQATVRGIDLRYEIDVAPGITLDSYPGALGQVLSNLLVNARIHGFTGRERGCLKVQASDAGDHVLIVFSDDGLGMAPEHLAHIFEPYYTTRPDAGGSGLGMSIVYNLMVHILAGRIEVSSQLDQGTRFELLIPKVAPAPSR